MSDRRFILRRLGWHQNAHGDHYTRRLPTAEPVATYDSFEEAEYDRRRREWELRTGDNPFRFGGATLYFQTSLDPLRLHDWLLDAGIEPPEDRLRHRDWREWWDAFAHTWSEEQLAHAWHGLDKVRFYDVAAEPFDEAFHVAVELQFAIVHPPALEVDREGGTALGVYRNARTALAACNRWNRERQQDGLYRGHYYLRFVSRMGGREREEGSGREAEFFEAIRIPGNVPQHSPVGFLVQRRAFDPLGRVCHGREGQDTGSRIPVRIFAEFEEAEAFRDGAISSARELMNPFQVFTPAMVKRSEREFAAAIERLNAPLPCPANFRPELWREWWDLCQDEISDLQRSAVWELFADQPLFEVVKMEIREE